MRRQIWTFLGLVWSEWSSRVTGSLSAVLVLLGLGISVAGVAGVTVPAVSIIQIATWLLAAICGGQAAYAVWARERSARANAETALAKITEAGRIEILFDDQDARFVRPIRALHASPGEHFWVGVHNAGKRTLEDVTLRAQEGWFVQNTLSVAHQRLTIAGLRSDREPVIAAFDALHPGATELINLFGLSYHIGSADDVFSAVRRFTLEARARDAKTITVEFEYEPTRRPMIRKLT
jgi:hypothetical protein